jgi:hypothetical protein
MGELVRLEAANRAEKIDHTEGGKYRMLEEGEKLEPSDQYFWHDRKEWDSVFGYAGYNRPFSKAFWGSDVRRPVVSVEKQSSALAAIPENVKPCYTQPEYVLPAIPVAHPPKPSPGERVLEQHVTKLERENAELREWKRQQLQLWSDLDLQKVGTELGVVLGTPVAENILPGIKNLKEDIGKLKRQLGQKDQEAGAYRGRDELQRARVEMLERLLSTVKDHIARLYNAL